MKDHELQFDRTCHVLYSRACKRQIQEHIAMHYPSSEREAVWERVQQLYVDYLSDWRTDLGGKRNFHNGTSGTYDCIALMAYYVVCKDVTSLAEIEDMETALILPAFRILSRFVDCNRPLFKRLMYKSFQNAAQRWRCSTRHLFAGPPAPMVTNVITPSTVTGIRGWQSILNIKIRLATAGTDDERNKVCHSSIHY